MKTNTRRDNAISASLTKYVLSKEPKVKPVTGCVDTMKLFVSPLLITPEVTRMFPNINNEFSGFMVYAGDHQSYGYDLVEISDPSYGEFMPLLMAKIGDKCYEVTTGIEIPIIDTRQIRHEGPLPEFRNRHPFGGSLDPKRPYFQQIKAKKNRELRKIGGYVAEMQQTDIIFDSMAILNELVSYTKANEKVI